MLHELKHPAAGAILELLSSGQCSGHIMAAAEYQQYQQQCYKLPLFQADPNTDKLSTLLSFGEKIEFIAWDLLMLQALHYEFN